MTDQQIAVALRSVLETEQQARSHLLAVMRDDLAERDAAEVVIRQSVALRKMLERWTLARASRAALTT